MNGSASKRIAGAGLLALTALAGGGAGSLLATCGPFTDFTDANFCPFVLEIFYLGITTGVTPTTYDPAGNVTRLQMAAFLSRGVDAVLRRVGSRAVRKQNWTTQNPGVLGITTIGGAPRFVEFDGADLWIASGGTVPRVRASDGRLLETWTGTTNAFGLAIGPSRVFVAGQTNPGTLFEIDPARTAGAVTTVASNLGVSPTGIAFDGSRVWTANGGAPGSVSIITPSASIPWTVTTFTVGVGSSGPIGALFDGSNVWVTDALLGTLLKLNSSGAILQTVTVGGTPFWPVFDGANIWVPSNGSSTLTVVRASNGTILQTLTGNGMIGPAMAAFDGERILVTNPAGSSVSLWKAADLTPLGSVPTTSNGGVEGACSDGAHFWAAEYISGKLLRF